MKAPTSVLFKVMLLIVIALLFGATMIALSLKDRPAREQQGEYGRWNADKSIEKTFAVQSGGKQIVDADVGSISVVGTDKPEVSIKVYARGSEEKLRKYDITFNQEGNTVTVRGKTDRNYFHFFENNSFDVHFEMQVPKEFNVDLQTSGGDIIVNALKGEILGETSGGNLELTDVDGKMKMSTSGGNITLTNATGDLTFETSGGNIEGKQMTGGMFFETSGGNITLRDSDGKLHASTSGGNILVQLKDNKGIELSTSGGSLTVRLPKAISADVRAEATGGDVDCDFAFSGKLKDGSLNGKINGGGNRIDLETSGGDIMITSIE